MDERRLEDMTETAQRRARRRAGEAQERVERFTGRPLDSWMQEARRYVQEHPVQAIALTIGLGFVLGKILARD